MKNAGPSKGLAEMKRIMLTLILAACVLSPKIQATAEERWVGDAPVCGASEADCAKYGMNYVRSSKTGNGEKCFIGIKVLCRSDPKPGQKWLGTAPACAAKKSDCQNELGMKFVLSAKCGDGNCCVTGTKVLCEPDKSAAPGIWLGTAPVCQARQSDCKLLGLEYKRQSKSGNGKACVTGKKVYCAAPNKPTVATKDDSADSLTVLSYNIFARPFIITHDGQIERTCRIPKRLADVLATKTQIDVIAIQESFINGCWDELDLRRLLAYYGWGYSTKTLSGGGRVSNGGVFIASKWPIVGNDQMIFKACHRDFEDCLAAKGVDYVKIAKKIGGQTRHYHVFATHFQAHGGNKEAQARTDQGKEFGAFVQRLKIPANQGVVFAGDFNVNRNAKGDQDQLESIMASMKAAMPKIVGSVGPISGSTEATHGSGTRWLDYVFYSTAHRRPKTAEMTAVELKPADEVVACMSAKGQPHYVMPRKPWCKDIKSIDFLSDHRPLLSRFQY